MGRDVSNEAREALSIAIIGNGDSSSSCCSHDEWWTTVAAKEDESEPEEQSQTPKIQKVPQMLREKTSSNKCYDPMVVSIGPYHHGKTELEEVERLKTPVAREYVKESTKTFEALYCKVAEVAGNARKCYAEEATSKFDDRAFTRMMFLDGCFILQFFVCLLNGRSFKGMQNNIVAFVQRDLFLLENQLPYHVLKELMSFRFSKAEEKKLMDNFIFSIRGLRHRQHPWKEKTTKFFSKAELDKGEDEDQPVHLLALFRTRFINKLDLIGYRRNVKFLYWYSYPAASELKINGIHFRPSWGDCFTDIKFTQTLASGTLYLPKLKIDDKITKSLLLNLVAYEPCPGAPDDYGITSYVCFMDSLIKQAEDVKELRSKRIIYNLLGSDQQAADLFKEIAKDLVPNPYAFASARRGIERHCKNRLTASIAGWVTSHIETYFSGPWTLVAFLAATFALILTFFQTHISWLQYCEDKKRPYFQCLF